MNLTPHLNRSDHCGVRPRVDACSALAIDARQRCRLALLGDTRHQRERHLAAAGPMNPFAGQVAQTAPVLGRIPDHDLDFLTAPLDALDLRAVETGAQLSADECRR